MNPGKILSIGLISALLVSCGADLEHSGFPGAGGTSLHEAITLLVPPDHRPYCGAVGSRSEGWYWVDSNELIAFDFCQGRSEPECLAIGSRSEGWYCDEELVTWHVCHQATGVALYGEPCEGSTGLTCYRSFELYCRHVPDDDPEVQAGVCALQGTCQVDSDCQAPGNQWYRPHCLGHAYCIKNHCEWRCDPIWPEIPSSNHP